MRPGEELAPRTADGPGAYKIDTLRVEPHKLDRLMALSGELIVTKSRMAGRMPQIEELKTLWEEWARDAATNGVTLATAEGELTDVAARRLAAFCGREGLRLDRFNRLLDRLFRAMDDDNTRLDQVADALEEGIQSARLVPLATVFSLFPRVVRDLARAQGKEVELVIEGAETTVDKRILEGIKDPLLHLVRNAVDHGLETPEQRAQCGKPRCATLRLRALHQATHIVVELADDGAGIDTGAIKRMAVSRQLLSVEEADTLSVEQLQSLIFTAGFSTRTAVTDISGRGVGLDVVRVNIERLKGTIGIDSVPSRGTTFRLMLPITLAATRVLLVRQGGQAYALPAENVATTRRVELSDLFSIQGRDMISENGHPVAVARLSDLLGQSRVPTARRGVASTPADRERARASEPLPSDTHLTCILLGAGSERMGLIVDELLDVDEVVLKPLGLLLTRVRNVSGVTLLSSGEICIVLNPSDLVRTAWKSPGGRSAPAAVQELNRQLTILLVEDSLTTRTQEKRILEAVGYTVVTAVDGLDGFAKLSTGIFDAVVTDVQMPNLDGFALAAKIRGHKQYQDLPIILVTSMALDEDRRKGIEVGANAYIVKSSFDQQVLLDTLRRLV